MFDITIFSIIKEIFSLDKILKIFLANKCKVWINKLNKR